MESPDPDLEYLLMKASQRSSEGLTFPLTAKSSFFLREFGKKIVKALHNIVLLFIERISWRSLVSTFR